VNLVITGASGYLGGRLVRALSAAGHHVTPTGRSESAAAPGYRRLDVLHPPALDEVLSGAEAVIHLASLDEREAAASPEQALRVSGEGTRLVLESARRVGVKRVLFFSTFHVYGPRAPEAITEDTATRAAHPYAIAHLTGEGFCREQNLKSALPFATIIRLSNSYGCPVRRDVDRWSLAHNDFCRQAVTTGKIVLKGDGLAHRDFVWIDDVCRATGLLLQTPADGLGEGVFNLGAGTSLSVFELAQRVQLRAERHLGKPVPIERSTPPVGATGTRVNFNIDRLRSLGFSPRDGLDPETDALLRLLQEDHA
jgi:UDP-glucose 4-epimerase